MAQSCEVCGRKPVTGNQITTRGKAKYLGGVGTKVTGISRRTFRPELADGPRHHARRQQSHGAGLHPLHSQWRGAKARPRGPLPFAQDG